MRRLLLLSTVLAMLFGMADTSWAQTATGQITGTVKDASGAVMAGAKVKVSSEQMGLTRETTTSDTGDYVFPLLAVGVYSVSAEQQGFKVAKRSDIKLNVDQVIRIDLELAVGEVTQTIEVQAASAAIDSETAAVGHTISQRQVVDLPLNGRNFLQLLLLGGAVETNGEQGTMRQGAGQAISINGARPTSNNYLLDGTSNTDTALGTAAAILSIDAIQEFKEQTTTYSAEYGFSANQINIVSKTGTNNLHGSVFYFGRNDAFDASNYFDNAAGRGKSKLRQHQFGFVAGGRYTSRRPTTDATKLSGFSTTKKGEPEGPPRAFCLSQRWTSWPAGSRRRSSTPSMANPLPITQSRRAATHGWQS